MIPKEAYQPTGAVEVARIQELQDYVCHFPHEWEFSQNGSLREAEDQLRLAIRHMVEVKHEIDGTIYGGLNIDESLPQKLSISFFQKTGLLKPLALRFSGHMDEAVSFAFGEEIVETGTKNGMGHQVAVLTSAQGPLELSERELVDRAKAKDQEATAALYGNYFPRVYRYILARTGNAPDSEDLAQDIFLQAFGAIDRFQWREAPFSAWVFRIAHNEVISKRRKDSVRKKTYLSKVVQETKSGVITLADSLEDRVFPDIDQRLDDQATLNKVAQACRHLTDTSREVIYLRFAAGLSVAETAAVMGKGEGNVKVIQHKAIAKLRRILGIAVLPKIRTGARETTYQPKAASAEDAKTEDGQSTDDVSHVEVAEARSPNGDCPHHWMIETPRGPLSPGHCKVCGAEREFRNSSDDYIWDGVGASTEPSAIRQLAAAGLPEFD